MKKYPTLYKMLRAQLGNKAPTKAKAEELQKLITTAHPSATHIVLCKNKARKYTIIPIGGSLPTKTITGAKHLIVLPNKKPTAYISVGS